MKENEGFEREREKKYGWCGGQTVRKGGIETKTERETEKDDIQRDLEMRQPKKEHRRE